MRLLPPCFNLSYFNPRSRVGSDFWAPAFCIGMLISIHAPAWGATDEYEPIARKIGISIHAPAWGATKM